jgi:hypothetical protein
MSKHPPIPQAAIVFARSVTFHLQEYSGATGFKDSWWPQQRGAPAGTTLLDSS